MCEAIFLPAPRTNLLGQDLPGLRMQAEQQARSPMLPIARRSVAVICSFAFGFAVEYAHAEEIPFAPDPNTAGWQVVNYPGIPPGRFSTTNDGALEVIVDRGIGWLWRPIVRNTKSLSAKWDWRVDRGVIATELGERGKDDRALGVWFIFGRPADASGKFTDLLRSNS